MFPGWSDTELLVYDGEFFLQYTLDGEIEPAETRITEIIDTLMKKANEEHRSLPAKFIRFYSDRTDEKTWDQNLECPYFYCIFSVDELK